MPGGPRLLSTTSSVAWSLNSVTHTALYAIDQNDSVEVSVDGGSFTNLGFYAKQISANVDPLHKPEVFAIGQDNAAWVDDNGAGFVRLGGYFKQIIASAVGGIFYAIGVGDDLYKGDRIPGDFVSLGGKARQISDSTFIGFDNAVYSIGGGINNFFKVFDYAK